MYKVIMSSDAELYFKKLSDYLLLNFDKQTVKKIISQKIEDFEDLSFSPYMGIKAKTIFKIMPNSYRILIRKHDYTFYSIDEENKVVSIEVIYNAKEDISKNIKKFISDQKYKRSK